MIPAGSTICSLGPGLDSFPAAPDRSCVNYMPRAASPVGNVAVRSAAGNTGRGHRDRPGRGRRATTPGDPRAARTEGPPHLAGRAQPAPRRDPPVRLDRRDRGRGPAAPSAPVNRGQERCRGAGRPPPEFRLHGPAKLGIEPRPHPILGPGRAEGAELEGVPHPREPAGPPGAPRTPRARAG